MSALSLTLLVNAAMLLGAMTVLWGVATARRDASLVDRFWGLGYVGVAWCSALLNSAVTPREVLLLVLVTVWGLRLSAFLTWRNWGQGEDRRYAAMRSHHGQRFWWVSLFTVFLLQGALVWLVSMPVQVAAAKNVSTALGYLDGAGVALWVVGMFFESVGDWQLAKFKADPTNDGRVMDRGLWRYTRHPNYFGDSCVWWGLYLIAAAGGAGWTIASPIVMSLLLLKVSGVALLEQTIADRRPAYREYKSRTNAFFPGPPRTG